MPTIALRASLPTFLCAVGLVTSAVQAAALPDDQVGVSYAVSDVAGDRIAGPQIEASARVGRRIAVSANYETDRVSAPEADLAAPLTRRLDENRQLAGLTALLLDGNTVYSVGASRLSGESTSGSVVRISVSQPLWHDLTVLTFGVSRGWDQAYRILDATGSKDDGYSGHAGRRGWWASLDQIVTPALKVGLDATYLDQTGSLGDPNRGVRFVLPDGLVAVGAEVVPGTRSRYGVGAHGTYALSDRNEIRTGIAYGYDTWGIRSRSAEGAWSHGFHGGRTRIDVHARVYSQGSANFYTDLGSGAPVGDISRDRSLAHHASVMVGVGLQRETGWHRHFGIQRWTTGFRVDAVRDAYSDFRDVTSGSPSVGAEPYYRKIGVLAQLNLRGGF